MLNSGHYRHPIEIFKLKSTGETDSYGSEIVNGVFVKRIFASVQSKTGSMLYGRPADTKLSKTTHKIEYRYRNFPELNEKYYIKYRNERYDIEYCDNRNCANEVMDVFVVKNGVEASL